MEKKKKKKKIYGIIGEHGQHAVYVPRVKAIVDAFKDFDVIVHRRI